MDKNLYKTFVNQFAMYNKEELNEILKDPESSEEAITAVKYILSGNSIEVKNYDSQTQKYNELLKEREDKRISNPSYDDIHQISKDIRFIKNIIIIAIVFEFINVIVQFL